MGYSKKGVFYPRPGRLRPQPKDGKVWCGSCRQYKAFEDVTGDHRKWDSSRRCPQYSRDSHQRSHYGITKGDQVIIRSIDKCHICGESGGSKGLGIDHNHTTGKIRGLLCFRCNQAIGLLRDDPTRIKNALKYIDNPPLDKFGIYATKKMPQRRPKEYKYIPIAARKRSN